MTFDRFGSALEPGTFESDMQRARGYKPITQQDLTNAYSQYSEQGLQFGTVKKNTSDAALYQRAKDIVLAWWKKQKTPATTDGSTTPPGSTPSTPPGNPAPPPPATTGGGSTGGKTTSGGATMPDTAMGTGGPTAELAHIYTAAEQAAMKLGTDRGMLTAAKADAATDAKTGLPLTATQVSAIMKSVGAPSTWKPPATALVSEAALKQWIVATAQKAQLILQANSAPILNLTYVNQMIKNMGITGVTAASVPVKYRVSASALYQYLLTKKAVTPMLTYGSKMANLP